MIIPQMTVPLTKRSMAMAMEEKKNDVTMVVARAGHDSYRSDSSWSVNFPDNSQFVLGRKGEM